MCHHVHAADQRDLHLALPRLRSGPFSTAGSAGVCTLLLPVMFSFIWMALRIGGWKGLAEESRASDAPTVRCPGSGR
jgi:hypothetical protein